jgi:NAD(P)-dependent dehydrogenase (short-subunit alcohol dehydrogenase family)
MSDLSNRTTVVVGASRGLGRGIASAFAEAGAPVVAVARTGPTSTSQRFSSWSPAPTR